MLRRPAYVRAGKHVDLSAPTTRQRAFAPWLLCATAAVEARSVHAQRVGAMLIVPVAAAYHGASGAAC